MESWLIHRILEGDPRNHAARETMLVFHQLLEGDPRNHERDDISFFIKFSRSILETINLI